MPSNNSKYTDEMRERTVLHILSSGKSATSVAEELGIDVTFNIVFFVGGYDEAKTFNYSSEWLDQLESYAIMDINGTISHGYAEYDEQGNPLEQTNFVFRGTTYDHAVFSWDGRQLTGISVRNADDSVAATIAYQYNDQGSRISRSSPSERRSRPSPTICLDQPCIVKSMSGK